MVMLQVASIMQGEWSCYRSCQFNGGGQFKGGRMVVTEVARGRIVMLQLMEGEWSLQRWPVYLTFKSPHLPIHQNMRGESEDFVPGKNRESMVM